MPPEGRVPSIEANACRLAPRPSWQASSVPTRTSSTGPHGLTRSPGSTNENDEIIGLPDGKEHDVAGSLVTVAIVTRTQLYLPRIVQ